jgi:hypothetical protein
MPSSSGRRPRWSAPGRRSRADILNNLVRRFAGYNVANACNIRGLVSSLGCVVRDFFQGAGRFPMVARLRSVQSGRNTLPLARASRSVPEASVVAFQRGETRHVFKVRQRIRPDAAKVISALRHMGLTIEILSGDRKPAVRAAAETLGIHRWSAGVTPGRCG